MADGCCSTRAPTEKRSPAGWILLQCNRATGRADIRATGRVMMEFKLSTPGQVTPMARRV